MLYIYLLESVIKIEYTRNFNLVLEGFVALVEEIIILLLNNCPYVVTWSRKLYPFFTNAIGVVDGRQIEGHVLNTNG